MADFTVNANGTIANDAVGNEELANMAQGTLKGRAAGAGTGDPTDLTPDQASTILDGASNPFSRSNHSHNYQTLTGVPAGVLVGRGAGGGPGLSEAIVPATEMAVVGQTIGLRIENLTEKVTPVSGDMLIIADSEDGNAKKMVQVSNLPAGSHTHDASDITSGVLSTDRLGTGTPNAGKLLRGDGAWSDDLGGRLTVDGLSSSEYVESIVTGSVDSFFGSAVDGEAFHGVSTNGSAAVLLSMGSVRTLYANNQSTGIALEAVQNGSGTRIASFTDGGDGAHIEIDGGLSWDDPTGAQTSRVNMLPSLTGNNKLYLRVNSGETDVEWSTVALPDGDYGDITVSSSGTVMNIDAGAVGTNELGGDITTAGKDLLDDANAAAQRTTMGAAPNNATFIVQTASSELSNEQALSSLATGMVTVTTGTGVLASSSFQNPGSQTLAASVTITAGGAPATPTNTYNWTQVGNLVTYQFSLIYASAGTTVTNVLIALPSDMPAPFQQSGLTAASDNLYPLTIRATNGDSGNATTGNAGSLRRNAGDTAYEFNTPISSGTYSNFFVFGFYFTA